MAAPDVRSTRTIYEGRIFTEGLPAELAAKPEIRRAYLGL